ncbi:MAG: preprotein translocase subunit SecE [Thermostichales cyanobacterium BF4_bins_65]
MVKGNVSSKTSSKDKAERLDPASRGQVRTEANTPKGILGFYHNVRAELEKVVWPSRQQLISESVAVLMIVVIFALFIYLVDQAFGWLAKQLFGV